jgi:hypothetical protein
MAPLGGRPRGLSLTAVIAEVERLRTLGKNDLRARWSTLFGKTPPPALTKDLLGRMIAWRIQEKFYGGHDKATLSAAFELFPVEKFGHDFVLCRLINRSAQPGH